jgi:hypothetical protein
MYSSVSVVATGWKADNLFFRFRFSKSSTATHGAHSASYSSGRLRLKRDGTRTETRFRLSPKRTSPFKSAVASVQSTAGSRGVCIRGSNAGYTMFRGIEGYWLPTPFASFPLLPLPCVTVCPQVSTGFYRQGGGLFQSAQRPSLASI